MSVVGHNGYLVKVYLLATYGILVNDYQKNCNKAFKRTSAVQTFGMLKKLSDVCIDPETPVLLLPRNCHAIKWIKQKTCI